MQRHLISLGWRCDTAFQLRMHGQENVAHFFDWLDTPLEGLLHILENDFDVFHSEGLILLTSHTPHCVQDLPTGVLFHHQFPHYLGNVPPDFLLHYPAFIQKFRYLAARFRFYMSEYPVTLVRQNISKQDALRLESVVTRRFPTADARFLYLNAAGETFETPMGRSHLLVQEGSLGIPSEWIRVLQLEGLIDAPYRHATVEILGAAKDDHNLSTDNRFSELQIREAIAINPEKIEFRLELSRWYALRNQWANAEEEALLALIRAPQSKPAQFAAIQAQWRCGHLPADDAAEQILAVLDSPNPPLEWLTTAALILVAAKRPQDALSQIRRALEISPFTQSLYFQQADCLFHLGPHEALILSIEAARRLGNVPARYEHILSNAYEAQGKLQEALESSTRAVNLQLSFNHLFSQAGILLKLEQYDEALEVCEKAKPHAGAFIQALENRISEIQSKSNLKSPAHPGLRNTKRRQEPQPTVFTYWTHPTIPEPLSKKAWTDQYHDFRVFSDHDVLKIIPTEDKRKLYNSIRLPAAKSDLARLLLLREYGGLYVDAHTGPASPENLAATLKQLLTYEILLFGKKWELKLPTDFSLMNTVIGARKSSPLLDSLINKIYFNLYQLRAREYETDLYVSYDLFSLTGTRLLIEDFFNTSSPPRLKPEYNGKIDLIMLETNASHGFHLYQFHGYREPKQHWSERQKSEKLFMPENI